MKLNIKFLILFTITLLLTSSTISRKITKRSSSLRFRDEIDNDPNKFVAFLTNFITSGLGITNQDVTNCINALRNRTPQVDTQINQLVATHDARANSEKLPEVAQLQDETFWTKIKNRAVQVGNVVWTVIKTVVDWACHWKEKLFDILKDILTKAWKTLRTKKYKKRRVLVQWSLFKWIKTKWDEASTAVKAMLTETRAAVTAQVLEWSEDARTLASTAQKTIQTLKDAVEKNVGIVADYLKSFFLLVIKYAKITAKYMWGVIKTCVTTGVTIYGTIDGYIETIGLLAAGGIPGVIKIITNLICSAGDLYTKTWPKMKELWTNLGNRDATWWGNLGFVIGSIVKAVLAGGRRRLRRHRKN